MKIANAIVLVLGTAVLGAVTTAAHAQQGLRPPAELPPDSFAGTQYVDSAGCVFIRAGSGGSVNWVPRVTRDRKQICGFEPTLPASQTRAVAPAAQVVVIEAKPAPRLDPVVVPVAGPASTAQSVSPQARFFPDHLVEQRRALSTVDAPKGFRPAWQDGRLNPRRAEQTRRGQEQMQQVWTNTVPRRLVLD